MTSIFRTGSYLIKANTFIFKLLFVVFASFYTIAGMAANQFGVSAVDVGYDTNIYVSASDGLYILDPLKGQLLSKLTKQNGLPDDFITSAIQFSNFDDGTPVLVAGTKNGGVAISIDAGKTFVIKNVGNGLISNYVTKIKTDSRNIIVGTDKGISIIQYNPSSKTFDKIINKTTANGLLNNFVNDLAIAYPVDSNPVCIIVAASVVGVSASQDCGATFTQYGTKQNGLPSNNATGLWAYGTPAFRTNAFATSTDSGFSPGKLTFPLKYFKPITTANGLLSNYVTAVGPKNFSYPLHLLSIYFLGTTEGLSIFLGDKVFQNNYYR